LGHCDGPKFRDSSTFTHHDDAFTGLDAIEQGGGILR
jgi:hypothetical protein